MMSGELEDSRAGLEKESHFKYGFGSFMPKQIPFRHKQFPHNHWGQPTWPPNKPPNSTPMGRQEGNLTQNPRTSNPGVSLPNIQVSKLEDGNFKGDVQSLKKTGQTSRSQGELDNIDHGYHNTSVWGHRGRGEVRGQGGMEGGGRLLPSLAAAGVFPHHQGKVMQGSSWWEWSKKEFRIKETKLRPSLERCGGGGGVCGPMGAGHHARGILGKGRVLFDDSVMSASDYDQPHTGL